MTQPTLVDDLAKYLGPRTKELREQKGLTVEALLTKIPDGFGVSADRYTRFENGDTLFPPLVLNHIAAAFNIPVRDYLMGGEPKIYESHKQELEWLLTHLKSMA